MINGWRRVARYSRAWSKGTDTVRSEETTYAREGEEIPGTLFLPRMSHAPLPAWVVLHGVTVPGRSHPSLVRFARALAATPAVVFTPEIPAWTSLQLDPTLAVPTIQAAVLALSHRTDVDPTRTGLLGFSFGAPQALIASAQPELEGKLKSVVGFGGYSDLHRILRFLFTGIHEWEGTRHDARPDPYGRWIVGANFLTAVPGFEDAQPLAATLHDLATQAGRRQIASWDPTYDGVKLELRNALPAELRETFDLFAPPAAERPDTERALALADRLHEAIRRIAPGLDPGPWADKIIRPVHLIHGQDDPLIPFTETRRLAAELRGAASDPRVFDTVTPLFAHSGEHDDLGRLGRVWESLVLARSLARVLASV